MKRIQCALAIVILLCAGYVWPPSTMAEQQPAPATAAAPNSNPQQPAKPAKPAKEVKEAPALHLGYLFPAGGQQGATFTVFAGGQYLKSVNQVYVSGNGIQGRVVHTYPPLRNLDVNQRRELARRIREAWDKCCAALSEEERAKVPPSRALPLNVGPIKPKTVAGAVAAAVLPVSLPDHPLLNHIADKNLYELAHLVQEIQQYRKRQPNAQLGSLVELEITIDADTAPGDRELRLGRGPNVTEPMCFRVGVLPEVCEEEPNDPDEKMALPVRPAITLPVTLNGQIIPGDVDRFRFQGKKGQQLTAVVSARALNPYLADAVPGWFQAVISLYDAKGKELAYDDDYYFNPDPVLFCTLPEDGDYELEIRDSIFRGREDFVYRVSLGELPFITRAFPAGGQRGSDLTAEIRGYNLPVSSIQLDTSGEGPNIRSTRLTCAGMVSNEILYAVGDLPEAVEIEPNNRGEEAQQLTLPVTVNGVISEPGDEDIYVFKGHAGEEVVAEVVARRLGSPLDSLIRLTDAAGKLVGWNDDSKDKLSELLTHHADAVLTATLPEDGLYRVHVLDTQQKGGPDWVYRLNLAPPRPDFSLLMTPATVNMRAGGNAEITLHVVRRGGFDGDIQITLGDMPPGFPLVSAKAAAGQESVQMTLSAPGRPQTAPIPLHIVGRAVVDGVNVEHDAIPAEDRMQAFLPRHLVPVMEALVSVSGVGPNAGKARPAVKKAPKARKAPSAAKKGKKVLPEGETP